MTKSVAVIGASGYAGMEFLRLAADHPGLDVVAATAQRSVGVEVGEVAPTLGRAYPDLVFTDVDDLASGAADVVVLALPHGASQQLLPGLDAAYVIDLAADFRLPADLHEAWYGAAHQAPQLLDDFVCGLPELFGAEIATARRVAAPGCYPTAATLALAPLVAAGVVETGAITVNALSGVSGRGRALSEGSLFSEVNESAHAYGLVTHRHTPEIEQMLGRLGGGTPRVQFTPHLVPMTRGIVATCVVPLLDAATTTADLRALADAFYADAPFVASSPEPVPTKAVAATNGAVVSYRADPRTGNAIAIAVIDNLVKGTSGQAVQALNLMLGLPETTGLTAIGVWP